MIKGFLFVFIFIGNCFADALSDGKSLSQKANQESEGLKDYNPKQLNMPMTDKPQEIHLNTHEGLVQNTEQQKNDALYQTLKKGDDAKDLYDINPHNPFDKEGRIMHRKVLKTVHKTCFEGGDLHTQTFKKFLQIDLKLIPEVKEIDRVYCTHHGWFPKKGPFPRRCELRDGIYDAVKEKVVKQRSVQVLNERWIGSENMDGVFEGHDSRFEVDVDFVEGGPETRNLQAISDPNEKGFVHTENEPVHRPCWEKSYTYQIIPRHCYECEALKHDQCRQVDAKCVEALPLPNGIKICLKWEKTFACDEYINVVDDNSAYQKANLIEPISSEANPNMYKALAQLEALKQIEQEQVGGMNISVFKGTDSRCVTNFGGSFKNCCTKNGGWGRSVGLGTKCSAEENVLQKARQENRCVSLGSRVKKRHLGVVVSRESVFCCFPSPIARAIQEGARAQLGIGFGNANGSQCRGLTPEELERVDFGNLDLSDAFSDISKSSKKMTQDLQRDFKQKQEAFKSPESIKNMEENNKKFKTSETLEHVENRLKAKEIEIRQTRDQRKKEGL